MIKHHLSEEKDQTFERLQILAQTIRIRNNAGRMELLKSKTEIDTNEYGMARKNAFSTYKKKSLKI